MNPEKLRGATRELVQALQIVDGSCCIDDMSLSEGHLLLLLAGGASRTATELCDALGLEKSTVSRIIQRLEHRGLISRDTSSTDGRIRKIALTEAGRNTVETINAVANDEVSRALAFMTAAEAEATATAFRRYARALVHARAAQQFELRPMRPDDNNAVAAVIQTVMTEFGAVGQGFSIEDPEVTHMFESYSGPRSAFWVIERGGVVLGCGGIAPLAGGTPDTCELRKMYFRSELRGFGMGMPLIRRCLETARSFGFRTCYLETLATMQGARALYERVGFRPIAGPLGATGHHGCDSYMTLEL